MEEDWRLKGQEKYLQGLTWRKEFYKQPRPDWDHDHCEFCMAKFMERDLPDTLKEGYTTKTKNTYYWVCENCFEDFKDKFEWKVL